MNIVIDEGIPFAYELFNRLGKVIAIPGRKISQLELKDADALIIRSITEVNKSLLSGKSVKFVGTVTSGTDHVDILWLKKTGINFSVASGCNSVAVIEYIFSALLVLSERNFFSLKDRIVGIIGVGSIGEGLQKRLEVLGVRTLLCDPPRALQENNSKKYLTLNELIDQVDILTFHTPLFIDGPYKTLNLVDNKLINRIKPGSILINASRGPVIDNIALLNRLERKQDIKVILDVWDSEPNINVALLNQIDIGTAHIAGYSIEGKLRGIKQIFEKYSSFIGKPQQIDIKTLLPIPKFNSIYFYGEFNELSFKRLVHLIYDVRYDDSLLRKVVNLPNGFDNIRKNYTNRHEWSSLYVLCDNSDAATILHKLGFNAVYNPTY